MNALHKQYRCGSHAWRILGSGCKPSSMKTAFGLPFVNQLGCSIRRLSLWRVAAGALVQAPNRKIGGSGRPSRVVDLLERRDHARVDLATKLVEEIVHVRLESRQALG